MNINDAYTRKYIIVGYSEYEGQYDVEIDFAETIEQAEILQREYQLAYGDDWTITIR